MKNKFSVVIILLFVINEILSCKFCYGAVIEPMNCESEKSMNNIVICIDPGHQEKMDPRGEPISPKSTSMKARVSAGTAGVATKNPEYKVNLDASMKLKSMLEEEQYSVVMTREKNDVNISNVERANIANEANADITIRIHCDSVNDRSKTGATILIPSAKSVGNEDIYLKSKTYANILKSKIHESNIKVNGVIERSDITGFNWSQVPVVILEMGFMSNWEEDKMLNDEEYQRNLMECVKEAVDEYIKLQQ